MQEPFFVHNALNKKKKFQQVIQLIFISAYLLQYPIHVTYNSLLSNLIA